MTYHPTDIVKTAIFFATKTENYYMRLTKFSEAIGGTKPEDVLASEFLLTQGLRFTFDVRHPFRALEGAVMELQAMASGGLPALPGGGVVEDRPTNMEKRVKNAHGKAREYLKTSALLTDVYFHFTPSQIMMASLLIADEELTDWYITSKFSSNNQASAVTKAKIIATIEQCAQMLKTVDPASQSSSAEVKALGRKLKKCRNPENTDLVGLQRAKREGEGGDKEKVVKKRKMERENHAKEGDDLFGPEIKRE